jgi:adenylate kinase family enzyme
MMDIIIFAGAPGSGKTTIGNILQSKLRSPLIDFGNLRNWHLDREWSNASKEEEQMAFENLIFVVQNYLKHDYKNIILNDLRNDKIEALARIFKDFKFVVISLVITNDEILKERVLGNRDSGFKAFEVSLRWNKELQEISFPNEYKVDNTDIDAEKASQEILEIIGT